MRTLKAILPLAIASMTFSSISVADFGSSHRVERERDSNRAPVKVQPTPFDFEAIRGIVGAMHEGAIESELGSHIDQADLDALSPDDAFTVAFEEGDELFEIQYNALDGVGVNVGNGKRFSSVPRPDLDGENSWASVLPLRTTGPNGNSCLGCHNFPVADGAGGVNDNTIRIDLDRTKKGMIERQSPHIFGAGGMQLVAEEMTTELQALRDDAVTLSCETGQAILVNLESKGVEFGNIRVSCNRINYRSLEGIDPDLIVKPFEWKGLTSFVRDFVRGASHHELGMQPVELVGSADDDFDSVTEEFTVGDVTALAIYVAGQQRPNTTIELNQIATELTEEELERYGLPLSQSDIDSIGRGETVFNELQCSSCHVSSMTVSNPVFSEPSRNTNYRDEVFPAGESINMPEVAITFDITSDIFVNEFELPSGQTLGNFERDESGAAIVRMYGDLKRYYMGEALAEDIDEGGISEAVFLTENLWGVGSTPPYLHDGRASTLTEAILYHGGEAKASKNLFVAASNAEKADLLAFLNSLVLYIAENQASDL